ncbi:MAG TPA: SpoIIE family protein phosphatase [Thermoanaerobaculia bacterium]|nr:SpoIIE family protein phosphatase [Thermoanaerobaculia bacterium]
MPLLLDHDVITMGRSRECVIPIDDRFLSRKHAEIVSEADGWILRDNGSVNGTFVNGTRVAAPVRVGPGDRIRLGDAELVIAGAAEDKEPVTDFFLAEGEVKDSADRNRIVHRLALELIADRPLPELFDFILDRVVDVMHPSRVALALMSGEEQSVKIVKMRPADRDPRELAISRTLIREVVRDRKVVAFTEDGGNEALATAKSIVAQNIYSALCAPLIAGETVLGVLYIDYQLARRTITADDAQLAAQIARVAAIKVESTRLREAALEKGKLDETLKLAQAIQMRMLPQHLPALTADSPFDIAASIRPAKQVGGDFYDFHATDDGRLYFCIGDVSGKGIPAALMMAVSRALFRSFILAGREPVVMMSAVNRQLCDETDDTMFVTAFCGVLDLGTGEVRYANAGHNPPLIVSADGTVRPLPTRPGLVLGYVPNFHYQEESTTLTPGELLYLYTDGISEAGDLNEQLFSVERLKDVLRENAKGDARSVAKATLAAVDEFAGGAPQSDDLALLCIRYLGRPARMRDERV